MVVLRASVGQFVLNHISFENDEHSAIGSLPFSCEDAEEHARDVAARWSGAYDGCPHINEPSDDGK